MQQPPPPWAPPPVGSYSTQNQQAPTSSEAIAALVLGLGAWLCFPAGFVAIWLGARARQQIRENPGAHGGDGLALAGMIVGGILGGIQLLFWMLYVAAVVFALIMHKP